MPDCLLRSAFRSTNEAAFVSGTCIPTHVKMRNVVWLAYGLIAIFSLYLSLKIVMGALGFDADSLFSITLWQGVHAGGWRWVERFLFTPDNWLLSIVSFNFLSFALFGPRPDMVVSPVGSPSALPPASRG